MSSLSVFNFESQEIRLLGTSDNLWWVASDVCTVLDIKNNRDALSRLDDDEKDVATIDTLGGNQEMSIISESGLYSLTLTSRKPEAKRFKKWITSVLLPTIRKTGRFNVSENNSTLDEKLEVFFKAQKVLDNVTDNTLRQQALTKIDEEAKSKYGFSIHPSSIKVGQTSEAIPRKTIKVKGDEYVKLPVIKDDFFYLRQIAKVIPRITAKKAIKDTFCMSSMTSRNAQLKLACVSEKARLNTIMFHLIEIGIVTSVGINRKGTPLFRLTDRYTSEQIVSKYKKYMIGVAS